MKENSNVSLRTKLLHYSPSPSEFSCHFHGLTDIYNYLEALLIVFILVFNGFSEYVNCGQMIAILCIIRVLQGWGPGSWGSGGAWGCCYAEFTGTKTDTCGGRHHFAVQEVDYTSPVPP